jgi:hypothetical protein
MDTIEAVPNTTVEFIGADGKQAYGFAGIPTKFPASVHAQLVTMGAVKPIVTLRVDDPWAAEVRAMATKPKKGKR